MMTIGSTNRSSRLIDSVSRLTWVGERRGWYGLASHLARGSRQKICQCSPIGSWQSARIRPPSRSTCAASSRVSREGSFSAIGPPLEHHPFLALPRPHRPRLVRALDAKVRPEEAAHLARGDREGGPGGPAPHREEAREQPPAGLDDRRHRPDVLDAASRIDGAEALVLPDAVECTAEIAPEGEDVLLDEFGGDALDLRERPRLDRKRG